MRKIKRYLEDLKKIQKRFYIPVVLFVFLFSFAACSTETAEELPLSVTMTKDDFEVTLFVPKSVYYVKELRKEDIIRSEITVRYVGEEEEVLVAHNQTLLSNSIQNYDEEARFGLWNERGTTSFQKGQSYTFPFEWEAYSREHSEQGIYKIGTLMELEFLDPETEEGTGKYVNFALNVFPVEVREKKGKALSFEKYEALWEALPEEDSLVKKAEAYAKELKETGSEKEVIKVLAGQEDDLVQYAVFYQEDGAFSGVEIVTKYGREFFTVGKADIRQSLYTEALPSLSGDGEHLRFSVITEPAGEICEYRVYIDKREKGKGGEEEILNYVEVTGKTR